MNKRLMWGIAALVIVVLVGGIIYQQATTNNQPFSFRNVVKKIHGEVTPDSHRIDSK